MYPFDMQQDILSFAECQFFNSLAAFRFLAASLYALSLDIARYAFGKVRINLLAINTEISTKSNDRFWVM